jgi:hypothetical protein
MFGPFVVRPLDSPKTAVLLVYELQVAIGLEAHLQVQKKNWGIMERSPSLADPLNGGRLPKMSEKTGNIQACESRFSRTS